MVKKKENKKNQTPAAAPLPPTKPKRRNQPVPPDITEARERRAYELRVIDGMKLDEITTQLNIEFPAYPLKSDHEGVRKMIIRVQGEYAKRDKDKIDSVLAESSAVLDWVRKESMEAFRNSKNAEKVGAQREQQLIEQKAKTQTGDAMYLKRITETVELKTKIFGAMAPKKHEVTGKDGKPLGVPSLDMNQLKEYLTNDDLEILQKAAEVIERAQRAYDVAIEKRDRSRETEAQP